METSLANQVAYLKQTNARKNLYQGNVSHQHTNVEMPHPVGIECSITVPIVKYHKIFQNIHIHIHDHCLFNKPQRSKYVIKQEVALMTFCHQRIPYTNIVIYAVTCLKTCSLPYSSFHLRTNKHNQAKWHTFKLYALINAQLLQCCMLSYAESQLHPNKNPYFIFLSPTSSYI